MKIRETVPALIEGLAVTDPTGMSGLELAKLHRTHSAQAASPGSSKAATDEVASFEEGAVENEPSSEPSSREMATALAASLGGHAAPSQGTRFEYELKLDTIQQFVDLRRSLRTETLAEGVALLLRSGVDVTFPSERKVLTRLRNIFLSEERSKGQAGRWAKILVELTRAQLDLQMPLLDQKAARDLATFLNVEKLQPSSEQGYKFDFHISTVEEFVNLKYAPFSTGTFAGTLKMLDNHGIRVVWPSDKGDKETLLSIRNYLRAPQTAISQREEIGHERDYADSVLLTINEKLKLVLFLEDLDHEFQLLELGEDLKSTLREHPLLGQETRLSDDAIVLDATRVAQSCRHVIRNGASSLGEAINALHSTGFTITLDGVSKAERASWQKMAKAAYRHVIEK